MSIRVLAAFISFRDTVLVLSKLIHALKRTSYCEPREVSRQEIGIPSIAISQSYESGNLELQTQR